MNVYTTFEEKKKSILLQLFAYYFLTLMVGFIIFNLVEGDYDSLIVNSLSLMFAGVLYYLFRVHRHLNLVTTIFVVVIMMLTTFFIQTGGIEKTGLFFCILIPLPAIMLVGRNKGLLMLMAFVVVNVLGVIVFADQEWYPHYDWSAASRLILVFFLIALMAFSNEFVFGVMYNRIQKLSDWLVKSQQAYKNLAVNNEHFVSLISNNLGDHIAGFSGIASLLNEEYDTLSEERKRELIRNLDAFARQNYRLLQDLARWSASHTTAIPYAPKAVKLEKIYREVVELFNAQITEKNLSFFLKMKSNSELYADENMLGAILRNIVSNSIKFAKTGGEIRVSAEEDGDFMRISVADNGVGMSEENLLRVNSSVSFSTPGTLNEPGTGIGLILVKEFLVQNRGSFQATSKLGEGTEVTFTVPLVE